jgi:hypothetical protein
MWSPPSLHIFASFCHPDAFYLHTLTFNVISTISWHGFASFCQYIAFHAHTWSVKCDPHRRYTFLLALIVKLLFVRTLCHSIMNSAVATHILASNHHPIALCLHITPVACNPNHCLTRLCVLFPGAECVPIPAQGPSITQPHRVPGLRLLLREFASRPVCRVHGIHWVYGGKGGECAGGARDS